MAGREHRYHVQVRWTGNGGHGTTGYRDYARDHLISASGKPDIAGSSDPDFRGDPARWNPEEMLIAALSTCHQLWYLHLAAEAGVVVTAYEDSATGTMVEDADGGRFTAVELRPLVTIAAGDPDLAAALHHDAHGKCFVANSVSFPVICVPEIRSPD